MTTNNLVYLLSDSTPTLEQRKRDVDVFKRTFSFDDLLKFIESNGFIVEMKKMSNPDDRFFYFTRVLEEYFKRPDIDFGCFILNSFQKRHPDLYLGMCRQLSIDLSDVGYVKICSPPGRDSFLTNCSGFRFDVCRDYQK